LEDTDDAEEIKKARAAKEETFSWKTAKKDLKLRIKQKLKPFIASSTAARHIGKP